MCHGFLRKKILKKSIFTSRITKIPPLIQLKGWLPVSRALRGTAGTPRPCYTPAWSALLVPPSPGTDYRPPPLVFRQRRPARIWSFCSARLLRRNACYNGPIRPPPTQVDTGPRYRPPCQLVPSVDRKGSHPPVACPFFVRRPLVSIDNLSKRFIQWESPWLAQTSLNISH